MLIVCGYVVLGFLGLLMGLLFLFMFYEWIRSWLFYHRVVRRLRSPLNNAELFSVLDKCLADKMRVRVLMVLRTKNLISPDRKTCEAIRARAIQEQKPPRKGGISNEKVVFCDELYRTLDQLRKQGVEM